MHGKESNKNRLVIAYDLGTGGLKTTIFTCSGAVVLSTFEPYDTYYPTFNQQEQSPDDWWEAIVMSTKRLLETPGINREDIIALSISGHSLGVIPIGRDGSLLRQLTPIWSDKRANVQAKEFFEKVDYKEWYTSTGGGFPVACYSLFKIMWYKEHEPHMYSNVDKIIGTKDYCNYRFTGRLCTDYSYASGSGAYELKMWDYKDEYINAAGLDADIFPEILESDAIVGCLSEEASQQTGLPRGVKVVCGGVDNSCMALGAKGIKESRTYTSLGSSAWVALVSKNPIVDFKYKPYVFAHVIKGLFTSATSIFSAGSSLKWVRNVLCQDLIEIERQGRGDAYLALNKLAEQSPVGSNGVLFNPSLSGGSMIEPTPFMQGAFTGLQLSSTRSDMIRATMEGIALNMRIALDVLKRYSPLTDRMLVVGGGAKSPLWMQIFADCYEMQIEKTDIDQEAASLGAAALALKGVGIWDNYDAIDHIHNLESNFVPNENNIEEYSQIMDRFKALSNSIATGGFSAIYDDIL